MIKKGLRSTQNRAEMCVTSPFLLHHKRHWNYVFLYMWHAEKCPIQSNAFDGNKDKTEQEKSIPLEEKKIIQTQKK